MAVHPASEDIALSLGNALDQDLALTFWQPVSGGSIHSAWQVHSNTEQSFFIKTNKASSLHMFQAEAKGLKEIEDNSLPDNPIRVPHVYAIAANTTYAWLVLEYIPFSRDTKQSEIALGKGLALLHQQTSHTFGLNHNNVIGTTLQINTSETSWLDFFAKHRLQAQFDFAKDNGFYHHIAQEAESLLDALPQLLANHHPSPALLHGDLWSGNKGTDAQHHPVLFDPAIYYGDRECDLAMTELFGGFSSAFYAAYEDVYPLEQGYQRRKALYNLYHILNHANLFGGHYIQQSQNIMQQLLRSVH